MRAMVVNGIAPIEERPLELVDRPDPEPGPGEISVRVRTCGVCRTDLHVIEGDLPEQRMPLIPGHQVVGVVDRLGEGCQRFAPGDRVGIAWLRHTCGRCEYCASGQENLCPYSRYTGYHEDGGYAEMAVVPEDFAYAIPDVFGDVAAAPLLCAGIIGYRALQRADVPPGGRLALYGFGSSAHVVAQIAMHRGYEIYAVSRGETHRELARRLGATWVGGEDEEPPEPMHSAIIFAPAGPIVPQALRSLRKGGTVATAGIYMTPIPRMAYEECLFHEKNLRSVEANTREDGRGLLREAAEVPVEARTTEFPLEQANEALLRLKRDEIDGTAVLRITREVDGPA